MKEYSLHGYAGLVQQTRARSTGSLVGVYACEQAGMDDSFEDGDHAMPWATVCEQHATVINHRSLATARSFAPVPEQWCEECAVWVATRNELPRPFSGDHFHDNEARCGVGQETCALCGKGLDPAKCPMIRVVDGGGRFATADEVVEEAGDMNFFPIGPECLRKNPGLRRLVVTRAAATTDER